MSVPEDNIADSERVASSPVSRGDAEPKTRREGNFWRANARRHSHRVSPLAPYLLAKPTALPVAGSTRVSDSGFTLLEIVVALAILGLSLTVLFGIFSQNVARTHLNETRAEERALANSLLLRAEAAASPADSTGTTASGLVWRVAFSSYGSRDDEKNWPQAISEITVTVQRADDARTNVTLRTLRLMPKAPAP